MDEFKTLSRQLDVRVVRAIRTNYTGWAGRCKIPKSAAAPDQKLLVDSIRSGIQDVVGQGTVSTLVIVMSRIMVLS